MTSQDINKSIKFKELNREIIYNKVVHNNISSINLEDIENDIEEKDNYSSDKTRYRQEKLNFINFIFDHNLENLIYLRKNTKFDYMIGFLLYISENLKFKYGFGYFKDKIFTYDKLLNNWSNFLTSAIKDIQKLPELHLRQLITLELNEVLSFEIVYDSIYDIKINLDNINKVFSINDSSYSYNIKLKDEILESGFCNIIPEDREENEYYESNKAYNQGNNNEDNKDKKITNNLFNSFTRLNQFMNKNI